MTRHASVHAAGVVIAPKPLTEFVPLYKSQKDEIATQWAMKEVERVGLLKMDFLGLSTLTLHRRRRRARSSGPTASTLDLDAIPLDDAKTYELFARRPDATACSSSRARACASTLRKAKPRAPRRPHRAQRALPPGPAQGRDGRRLHRAQARPQDRGQVRAAAAGADPARTPTASSPTRNRSCGSPAMLAGFTLGQADMLRKAMGKKDAEGHGQAARRLHGGREGQRHQRRRRPRRSST